MKLLQVTLLCDDLNTIEHFYSDKLQLPLIHKDAESISYKAGRSLLRFKLDKTLKPVYHVAFEIPGNKLEAAMLHFNNIGWIHAEDKSPVVDFKNWNATSIYFYDDNDNILEFIVRYDNDIKSDQPFDATGILNISEIGLVTEEPMRLAKELEALYGLSYYEKQPPRADFCAVGNADGLFILSGNNRNWFPTEVQAVQYPVYVQFETNNRIFELDYK